MMICGGCHPASAALRFRPPCYGREVSCSCRFALPESNPAPNGSGSLATVHGETLDSLRRLKDEEVLRRRGGGPDQRGCGGGVGG